MAYSSLTMARFRSWLTYNCIYDGVDVLYPAILVDTFIYSHVISIQEFMWFNDSMRLLDTTPWYKYYTIYEARSCKQFNCFWEWPKTSRLTRLKLYLCTLFEDREKYANIY